MECLLRCVEPFKIVSFLFFFRRALIFSFAMDIFRIALVIWNSSKMDWLLSRNVCSSESVACGLKVFLNMAQE